MKLFLGIVPPLADAERIDGLRGRYPGRLVGHVEPHATLVPPFELAPPSGSALSSESALSSFEEERLAGLSGALIEALRRLEPPLVRVGEPAFFDDRVLYFSVIDDKGALPLLRRELFRALRDFRGGSDGRSSGFLGGEGHDVARRMSEFHPHFTLAMRSFGTPVWAMARMYADAAVLAPSFTPFLASSVRLFVRGEEGWRRRADLPVGPGEPGSG